jgi:hypothetical protein
MPPQLKTKHGTTQKNDIRLAGNLLFLKRMITEKYTNEMTHYKADNCYTCNIDKIRNYEK